MSFFDIFSTKSIDSTIDAVIDTGDMIIYTDEEKAKALQLAVETKLKMLPLYEPFKLAQRYIAFAFTGAFLSSFMLGIIFVYFDLTEAADGLLELVQTYQLGWIMATIVAFYFSGGFVNSLSQIKGK